MSHCVSPLATAHLAFRDHSPGSALSLGVGDDLRPLVGIQLRTLFFESVKRVEPRSQRLVPFAASPFDSQPDASSRFAVQLPDRAENAYAS